MYVLRPRRLLYYNLSVFTKLFRFISQFFCNTCRRRLFADHVYSYAGLETINASHVA